MRRLVTIGAIAGLLAGGAGASVPAAAAAANAPQTTGIGSLR